MEAKPTIFGIRHHGPGSARSLLRALDGLKPDCILVEGPQDADDLIPLAGRDEMKPPVAILVHSTDEPSRAVYYPFATFSPEWNAIRWALKHDVPVRFMDLPQAQRMAIEIEEEKKVQAALDAAKAAAAAPPATPPAAASSDAGSRAAP